MVRKVGGLGNGSGTHRVRKVAAGPGEWGWRAVRAVEGGGRWVKSRQVMKVKTELV